MFLRRRNTDRQHVADCLRAWRTVAPRYSHYTDAQALLRQPYVLERSMDGARFQLLIVNEEGKNWYDNPATGTEFPLLSNFGMIRSGDVVFDCGGNQAVNALVYAHAVGPSGTVHTFDPFPLNGEIIRRNIELNATRTIVYHPVGLSNRTGTIPASAVQQSTSVDPGADAASDTVYLSLRRLDDFAHLEPDFIKIDIEGAEVEALEGAQEVLRSRRPAIYLELHPPEIKNRFQRDPMQVFDLIDLTQCDCRLRLSGRLHAEPYNREFALKEHCALFFLPKDRQSFVRYYG